jgi:hypothetical protein
VKLYRRATLPIPILAALFVLVQTLALRPLTAQAARPSAHAAVQVANSGVGFSYSLPGEWEVLPSQPAPQPKQEQTEPVPEARQGIGCIDVPLTARRGNPASVIVVVALPFDCFGQTMAYSDLPGFGDGAAQGLKQTLDIIEPIAASYKLAGHAIWIQRAKATPKGKTAPQYTVEIACTVLEKGAVCWLAQAADAAALEAFEHASVTLDGAQAGALVPQDVFVKNP